MKMVSLKTQEREISKLCGGKQYQAMQDITWHHSEIY